MTDIAGLGIRVATSGVKEASAELDSLAVSGERAAKSSEKVGKSLSDTQIFKANSALANYRDSIAKTVASSEALASANSNKLAKSFSAAAILRANNALANYRDGLLSAKIASEALTASNAARAENDAKYAKILAQGVGSAPAAPIRAVAFDAASAAAFNASAMARSKALGVIDAAMRGNIASAEGMAAAEAALDSAMAIGAITAREQAAYFVKLAEAETVATAATNANTAANVRNASSFKMNARLTKEFGTAVTELASGNTGRLKYTAASIANQSGLMSLAFSGVGLAVTSAGLAITAFTIAAIKGAAEQDAYNKALITTGNYAGVTSDKLAQMAQGLSKGVTTQREAADVLAQVAASGKFTATQIGLVGQAAIDMARLTGQGTADTIKQFESLQHAPLETVLKLNESQHFLTSTIYEQIKALQDQGKEQDAANLAMQTYGKSLSQRANEVEESAGTMVRAWHGVRDAAKEAWNAMLNVGRPDTGQEQFDALAARRDQLIAQQSNGAKFDVNSGQDIQKMIDAATKSLSAMQDARIAVEKAANKKSLADQAVEAQAANDAEVSQYASNADKRNKEKLAAQGRADVRYAAAMAAGNKTLAQKILDDEVKIQAGIDAKYKDPTSRTPRAKVAPNFRVQDMAELRKEIEEEGKLMDQRIRSTEAVKAYRNSLQDMLATRQATIYLQVASVGMGQREIAQQQALIAIDEDYNRQKSSLERQQRNSTSEIDKAGFAAQLSDLKRYHDDRVKLETEGFARSSEARDNWALGAQAATKDFMDGAKDIAGATYSVVTNIYTGLADNMADFFTKGKADWKGFVADILKQIVRIQTAKAVAGIASSLSGSFGFQGGTSASTFAKGGVFDSPSLSAYSSGVYSSPQPFKFAKGAGVFGEAGPEAIMPLSRGPDGKLGVKASGGGGGGITLNQTIVVDSKGGSENTSGTGDDNLRQFAGKMKGIAQQAILDEQRPGGSLWRMGQRA